MATNRAMPITREEFQNAVIIIRATDPDAMLRYFLGDRDLTENASIAAHKLRNQSDAARIRNTPRKAVLGGLLK